MIPSRSIIQLQGGRRIDTAEHEVNVELTQLIVLSEIFRDQDHVNLIIDGVLEAVMNRFQISYENPEVPMVYLRPCQVESCHCWSTGPMIVQTLLSETDVTLSPDLRKFYADHLNWTRVTI